MAWNDETKFRHAGFRAFYSFRVFGNLGCVLMVKPWLFVVGAERWHRGFGVFLGPLAAGFGPIDGSVKQSTDDSITPPSP